MILWFHKTVFQQLGVKKDIYQLKYLQKWIIRITLLLIEKWESKDDQLAYLKFREEEGPDGALAQLMPLLDGEPKFIYWNIDSVY